MTKPPILIPPMLVATISMGISSLDGVLFKDIGKCPQCGGKPRPYDTREKHYATLKTPQGERKIKVKVRRYVCENCGKLLYADEPFYPNTRVGSSIIDLALSLSRVNSYTHATKIMESMGILENRGSIRNYALSSVPMTTYNLLYGLPIPNSFISLMGRGLSPSGVNPSDILKTTGYPSRYRIPENGEGTAREFFMNRENK